MMQRLFLPFMFALLGLANSAHILAVLPILSKSHSIFSYSILRLLALRGHDVVVYSPFAPPCHVENLTHVYLDIVRYQSDGLTFERFRQFFQERYFGTSASELFEWERQYSEQTLQNKNITNLISSKEEFDLVILEALVCSESLIVFGHRFNAPVVNLQAFSTWTIVNWMAGNSLAIPYLPDALAFPFTDKMSFTERLRNFISNVGNLLYYHLDHLPKSQQIVDRLYHVPGTPPIKDLLANISLTLTNALPSLEYPRPYTPNMVAVGDVHRAMHMTPLPKNIKQFMDRAEEGVIYFSLGTFIPDHLLPQKYIEAFVETFRKLKKKVLWKINRDAIPGLPDNVLLSKWVPQPAVLAHPNCHLFITHGGLFSQLEAFYAGKPVVGIPFITEQSFNVGLYKRLGVGVQLDLDSITRETVHEAISTVINNPRYLERAKAVRQLYLDQEVSAPERAVFWVEYVLRHRGAAHLRPASVTMPWYQLALIDVIGALALTTLLLVYIVYKLVRCLFQTVFISRRKIDVGRRKKVD